MVLPTAPEALCQNCVRYGRKPPSNADQHRFTPRRSSETQMLESIALPRASTCVSELRLLRFPSVLLQPLGHLSVRLAALAHGGPFDSLRSLTARRSLTTGRSTRCVLAHDRPFDSLRSLT